MIVLILDDHPPIIEFLAIKLQEINSELTILEANTVEQALHLLESQEVQ
jgi:response regulator RpfG family c-di-GMP phosphodiesterase